MKKRKNVGKRISIFTIVLALAVAIMFSALIINWVMNSGTEETETVATYEEKTDKQKYEEAFYENGWDREIVAEIKEEVPIPNGFEYVSGKKETGFIIQDKATSQKMMWIPYDENVELENIDEYYANIKYDTIEPKAYKNMTKYGGFYVALSETSEYGQLKNLSQEIYDTAKKKAEELYSESEVVNSHLLYKTEIEQVLAFANKNGISIEQTSNSEKNVSVDKLIATNTEVKKVDLENLNLSPIAINMETDSQMGPKGGFSSNNWYIYDVPMIIKTPSGKELTVPIPVGYDAEINENETVVTITSQGENNLSYVWVPVNEEFNTKDFSKEGIEQLNANLKQAYGIADRTQEQMLDYAKDPTGTVEYEMLQKSIEEYGGFYMGQAELGFDNESSFNNQVRGLSYITNENGTKETYAKNGDYYRTVTAETAKANTEQNGANYANSALEKNEDGSYTLTYEKGKELAEKANEGHVTVAGNLVYGAQWNAALLWIINSGNGYKLENIVQDSNNLPGAKYEETEWEKETDSIETINGLYGIAGNISDLTQEKYSESNNTNTQINPVANSSIQAGEYNIGRGGNYGTTGKEKTASGYQIIGNETETSDAYGIRDCLILYVHDQDLETMEHRNETVVAQVSNEVGVVKTAETSGSWYIAQGNKYGKLHGNGKAILIADLIHSWMVRNNFKYNMDIIKYVPLSINQSNSGTKNQTDCSHYMSLILYEYGFTGPFTSQKLMKNKTCKYNVYDQFLSYDFADMCAFNRSRYLNYGMSVWPIAEVSHLAPGDIVVMRNENHVQMYAGNNCWYNAGSNDTLSRSKNTPYYDTTPYNLINGAVRLGSSHLSYHTMHNLFLTYNSKAWYKSINSIGNVRKKYGDDTTVLYTIVSLAKSRNILTEDTAGWKYWTNIIRAY